MNGYGYTITETFHYGREYHVRAYRGTLDSLEGAREFLELGGLVGADQVDAILRYVEEFLAAGGVEPWVTVTGLTLAYGWTTYTLALEG